MKKLNGWQRLWLGLCFVWWASILTITAYEYNSSKNGWFSGLSLPVGTVFTENYVKLPNGREIPIDIEIEGKTIEPWEIKWDNEPEIPTIQFFNWQALIVTSLLPIILGILFLFVDGLFSWVCDGFRKSKTNNPDVD